MADTLPPDGPGSVPSSPSGGVPDLGLPVRYAYQATAPYSLGWWSEPDGAEPPAAAQRPVESQADPERALRLPLVPIEERHEVALPAKTPWPIHGAPFALLRKEETMGRYVGWYLAPYLEPYNFVVPQAQLATVAPHGPGYDELGAGAAMQWLATWHQLTMSSDHVVRPSLAWVARVLSVLLWCTQPRVDSNAGDVQRGRRPSARRRVAACACVASARSPGGGNLHAMVCLAWFSVVDASRRLAAGPARVSRTCRRRTISGFASTVSCATRWLVWARFRAIRSQLWSARSEALSVALSRTSSGASADRRRSRTRACRRWTRCVRCRAVNRAIARGFRRSSRAGRGPGIGTTCCAATCTCTATSRAARCAAASSRFA